MATDLIEQYRNRARVSNEDMMGFYSEQKRGFMDADPGGDFNYKYAKRMQEGFVSKGDMATLDKFATAKSGTEMDTDEIRAALKRANVQKSYMEGAKKLIGEREHAWAGEQKATNYLTDTETNWWTTDEQQRRSNESHQSALASAAASRRASDARARASAAEANKSKKEADFYGAQKQLSINKAREDKAAIEANKALSGKELVTNIRAFTSGLFNVTSDKNADPTEKGETYRVGFEAINELADGALKDEALGAINAQINMEASKHKDGFWTFGTDERMEATMKATGVTEEQYKASQEWADSHSSDDAKNYRELTYYPEKEGNRSLYDTVFGKKTSMKEDNMSDVTYSQQFHSSGDSDNYINGEINKEVAAGIKGKFYTGEELPRYTKDKLTDSIIDNIGYNKDDNADMNDETKLEIKNLLSLADGGQVDTSKMSDSVVKKSMDNYNKELELAQQEQFTTNTFRNGTERKFKTQADAIYAGVGLISDTTQDTERLLDARNGRTSPIDIFTTIDNIESSNVLTSSQKNTMKGEIISAEITTLNTFGINKDPALITNNEWDRLASALNIEDTDEARELLTTNIANIDPAGRDSADVARMHNSYFSNEQGFLDWNDSGDTQQIAESINSGTGLDGISSGASYGGSFQFPNNK